MKPGVVVKKFAFVVCLLMACTVPLFTQGNGFNTKGNVLIADQFNNRVIEVNPLNHQIVWQFGNGSSVAVVRNPSLGLMTPSVWVSSL
jgi:hypothetical protein